MASAAPTVRRRTVPATAVVSRGTELGVSALAVLMRSVKLTSSSIGMLQAPLEKLASSLASMPDASMFADWSPPRDRPSVELSHTSVKLSGSSAPNTVAAAGAAGSTPAAAASSRKSEECSAERPLAEGASVWMPSSGRTSWWSYDLGGKRELSSVVVTFKKGGMPESFELELNDAGGSSTMGFRSASKVTDKSVKEECVLALPPGTTAARMRLSFTGTGPGNSDGAVALQRVRVMTYVEAEAFTPGDESMRAMITWLASVADTAATLDSEAARAVRDAALRVILGLARVHASSSTLLHACKLLLAGGNVALSHDTAAAGVSLLTALTTAIAAADETAARAEYRTAAVAGAEAAPAYGVIVGAAFDPAEMSSSYASLSNDNRTVSSTSSSNSHALLNVGPFTEGKGAWEFKLDEDTNSQCSCFGAAVKPVESSNYENATCMYMYRAYNGYRYTAGSCNSSDLTDTDKVKKGDTIRFELDMDDRDGVINAFINGRAVSNNPVFKGLRGKSLWPAVAFYSSGRTVSIVSVEGPLRLGPGGGGAAAKAAAPRSGPGKASELTQCTVGVTTTRSLADLAEAHVITGQGTFGKNGDLGVGKPTDDRKVRVGGTAIISSLALHPPPGGAPAVLRDDAAMATYANPASSKEALLAAAGVETSSVFATAATVVYWCGSAYEIFTGSVALNDSATSDVRAGADASPVFFEIYGDGALLWRSTPFHLARTPAESFQVSLSGVRVLRLVTRCVAGNAGALAIWLSPSLTTASEWSYRGWRNDATARTDAITRAARSGAGRVPTATALGLPVSAATSGVVESKEGDAMGAVASSSLAADAVTRAHVGNAHGLAHAVLAASGVLAHEYMRTMRFPSEIVNNTATVDLEAPFALECSPAALSEATTVFNSLAAAARSTASISPSQAATAAAGVVQMVTAALRRAATCGLAPADTCILEASTSGGKKDEKKGGGINKSKTKDLETKGGGGADDATFSAVGPLKTFINLLYTVSTWGGASAGKSVTSSATTTSAAAAALLPLGREEVLQRAIWDALILTRDVIVPSRTDQMERVKALTSTPGTLEFDLIFPCEAFDKDGEFVPLETILLQLQMLAGELGWRTRVAGAWPARIYLLLEVPAGTTVASFLEGDLTALFAQLDMSAWWHAMLGNAETFPVCVERSATWDRSSRGAVSPGFGSIHVYPAHVATLEQVHAALQAFLPPAGSSEQELMTGGIVE